MAEAAPNPVVVIGLDACDPGLAREMAAAGEMPALARLLAAGGHCRVDNPVGLFVGALWVSFATGLRPDRHHYHCWDEIDVPSYRWRLNAPAPESRRAFWARVGDAGFRVAAVDVPHSRAPERLNGIEIAEWGCHDRHFGFHAAPARLAGEIAREYGLHPVLGVGLPAEPHLPADDFACRKGRYRTAAEEKELAGLMIAGAGAKGRMLRDLRTREAWDLFVGVFGESHALGHQSWHLHDPAHPRHDPAVRDAAGGDPMRRLYRALDEAVAHALEGVGPETFVLLHLSHGMAAHHDGTHLLDEALARLDGEHRGAAAAARRLLKPLLPPLQDMAARLGLPGPLRRAVARRARGELPAARARRRFFQEPNNCVYGGIRLNLVGREPAGRVAQEDAGAVCAELERELLALANVATGRPAVRAVIRASEHYRRADDDCMPDLFVDWDRSAPIETVFSPRIGILHAPYTHWRTGDHRPEGLLVAAGPGIARGVELPPIAVEDIAPSVCARLGVDPGDMDGRAVPWLAQPALAEA